MASITAEDVQAKSTKHLPEVPGERLGIISCFVKDSLRILKRSQ